MASHWKLTTIALALPFVTSACFQSPPSTDMLRKPDVKSAELSSFSANSSDIQSRGVAMPSAMPYSRYAKKHGAAFGLDWKLIVAVMEQESSFRHNVTSHKGAYGLMQIMPHTQAEIQNRLGISEARSPYNNVKAGSYYLKRLSRSFKDADEENRLKLTLAAYNAGLTRVRDAQRIAAHLGEDKNSWEHVRASLQLLSRRFSPLHQQVWDSGKPRGGHFGNPKETIEYVDDVVRAYDDFMLTARDDNAI